MLVERTFNPSIQEADIGRRSQFKVHRVNFRTARATQKNLSQKLEREGEVFAHVFNLSTEDSEPGRSLCLRPTWSI